MKVYYNGFNLHGQFPSTQNIVENFIDHTYQDLSDIEVSYQYVVLLVADIVVLNGAKNQTLNVEGKVAQISCTEDKVLVLLQNGDLLKIAESVTKVPKLPDLEDNDRIIKISTGSKITVVLTDHGLLYNPNKLDFNASKIIEIKTGREHCLLLDKDGNVFSFGSGSRGQLGHGSLEDESEPKFVEALGGIKIRAVAAGGWHSCALSQEGDLYTWGWNGGGQLGIGEDAVAVMATPKVVEVDFNVELVGCGCKHTVILTDGGKLYGCGWNKYKQLKNDDKERFPVMTYLGDFSKEEVRWIKCGPWNTLVCCKS